jgi:enterochelin esterase family protein
MAWLWREYDPAKTERTYQMEAAEGVKPLLLVGIVNRDT